MSGYQKAIGLMFGSFNPIHQGHLIIANFMATQTDLDEVWFVVSPQNPLKSEAGLAPQEDRYAMVKLAVSDNPRFSVSDVEFHLEKPSYTIQTLEYLREEYPENRFVLIIGGDNMEVFKKWKAYERILAEFPVYAYLRPGYPPEPNPGLEGIRVFDAPFLYVSATWVRHCLKEHRSIRYLVPDQVIRYIEARHLYASDPSEDTPKAK